MNGEGDELRDLLESDARTPDERVIEVELRDIVKKFSEKYEVKVVRTYLKIRLRSKTTDYTTVQAAKDLGISRIKLYDILNKMDEELRSMLLSD